MTTHDLARRRPITMLLIVLLPPVYLGYAVVLLTGLPFMLGQVIELVCLIAAPLLVSGLAGGRSGIRRLYAGLLRWRFAPRWWVATLLALPALALIIAIGTGTLGTPADGWPAQAVTYGLVLIAGALTANLWEETVWGGFVQGRLMARHGLLVGSLLAAVPFAAIHLPLGFQNGLSATSPTDVLVTWGFMIALAPFLRYLIGILLIETGGSTLAAGLLHASMNAAMAMSVLGIGWQALPALVLLTLGMAALRRRRGDSLVRGHAPQLDLDGVPAAVRCSELPSPIVPTSSIAREL